MTAAAITLLAALFIFGMVGAAPMMRPKELRREQARQAAGREASAAAVRAQQETLADAFRATGLTKRERDDLERKRLLGR